MLLGAPCYLLFLFCSWHIGAASVTGERSLVARLSRAAGDFSTFNLYEDSDEGEEQGDAAEDEDAASDNLECGIREVYPATIPAGKVDLDSFEHLTLSGEKNVAVECSIACCELGPRKCQYAWILENECIAVACSKEHADKCLPGNMGVKASIYVSMSYTAPSVTTVAAATAIVTTESSPASSYNDQISTTPQPPSTPGATTPLTFVPSPPSIASTEKITVSFAGKTDITLPEDSTHIVSSTWPRPRHKQHFLYTWKKLSGPSRGTLDGIDSPKLSLSGLVAGVYVFKLTVTDWPEEREGEGVVNITVHPAAHHRLPPTPVIKPSPHSTIALPLDSALFDASESHDDTGSPSSLSFHWEEVEGPVEDSTHSSQHWDKPILQLTGLKQGSYKYKLTVTDQHGLSAEAFASVTVKPEPYYPPLVSAGKDQLIKLPHDEVTLDGSGSSAFKGELTYSWEKLAGPGSLDMKGSHTPVLHVQHISSTGAYLFRLTVTDSRGKSSSANVSVIVQPEHNLPPVADPGQDLIVRYPLTSVTINGSGSTDDFRIDSWTWTQLSGPGDIKLHGQHSPLLEIEGLHIDEAVGSPTLYQFQLTVEDYHNLTNSSTVSLTYSKDPKVPPHVSTGPSVNITLPQDTVILNGSGSYDDFGIASYNWVRSKDSPAAGLVVGDSDGKPVLILSNLVQGSYNFTLTVTSREDMVASAWTTVTVLPSPQADFLLLVYLEEDVSLFSLARQKQLERILSLILDDIDVDYDIIVEDVRPFGPAHIQVEFYAERQDDHTPLNATLAYEKLTEKGQDYYYPNSNFHFVKIQMKVCHLACSGHGSCDRKTHTCSCSRYWMENPFKARFGRKETNCEWSVFYVALAVLLVGAALFFLIWLTCYCCMRRRRIARTKRRVRYAILDRKEKEEGQEMLPRDPLGYQQSSLMVSESEAEEDILFESSKDKDIRNGSVPTSVKIRTNSHHNNTAPISSNTTA